MTAFTASVTVNRGALDAATHLDDLVASAMPDVSREMRSAAIDTFRDATDPWHHPWPPLKPATLGRRERKGNSRVSPLVDTSAMFDSIDNTSTRDTATVEIGKGLPDPRAPANLLGTDKIPQRAVFPLSHDNTPNVPDDYVERVTRPIRDALEKSLS